MNFNVLGVKVSISYPFLAVVTAFLALDKTGLGGQMLCAALLHELSHLAVMFVLKQPPRGIDFIAFGIRIRRCDSTALSYYKEILVFAAGPLANLAAAAAITVMYKSFTQLAQVHMLLGLFNLLPIGVLDGGMIIKNIACLFSAPARAEAISRAASFLFLLPIAAAELFLLLHGAGSLTLIVTCVYLGAGLLAKS